MLTSSSLRLFLLFAGISFSSVYLFPSGLPQVADLMLVVFSLLTFAGAIGFRGSIHRPSLFVLAFSLLSLVVFLVSSFWSVWEQDATYLVYTLYWLYNLTFLWAVGETLSRDQGRALRVLRAGLCVALIIAGVGALPDATTSARGTSFFNNPNQLAYFSVCAIGCLLLIDSGRPKIGLLNGSALLLGIVSILVAQSLAGYGGAVLLALAMALASGISISRATKTLMVVAFFAIIVWLADHSLEGALSNNASARIERLDGKISGVEEDRRFDRISDNTEYLLLGAGEGGYYRFRHGSWGEIHSSFLNVWFAYGFAGLLCFLGLIWLSVRRSGLWVVCVVTAPLVYSLTHMGLRSTLFWLLLFLAYWTREKKSSP